VGGRKQHTENNECLSYTPLDRLARRILKASFQVFVLLSRFVQHQWSFITVAPFHARWSVGSQAPDPGVSVARLLLRQGRAVENGIVYGPDEIASSRKGDFSKILLILKSWQQKRKPHKTYDFRTSNNSTFIWPFRVSGP
jgi:hypothetical protein